jgi:hypothetical protein
MGFRLSGRTRKFFCQLALSRHLGAVPRSGPEVLVWEVAAPVTLAVDYERMTGKPEVIPADPLRFPRPRF